MLFTKAFFGGRISLEEDPMKYEIIRSDRRTVTISIKEGRVILRGPMRLSDKDAEKIILSHEKWILEKLEKHKNRKAVDENLSDEQIAELRVQAKKYFKDKAEYFSKIMNLKYGRITITGAKTRFGSCSSKRNISFSYRLMLYPEAAREYVVVHELAHLVEMNHSKRFYAIIERYLPDYKERRRLLKNGG